jgi:low affinity Fe/Cu permease
MKKKQNKLRAAFDRFSTKVTKITGSPMAFILAFAVVIIWAVTGPVFHFSDTWQLVINTGTTIITFLMVFLIQQSQNKDTMALQLKLNELIATNCDASNRLINVEDITEEELETLKKFYIKLATLSKSEKNLFSTHSIDEATARHMSKLKSHSASMKGSKTQAEETNKKQSS